MVRILFVNYTKIFLITIPDSNFFIASHDIIILKVQKCWYKVLVQIKSIYASLHIISQIFKLFELLIKRHWVLVWNIHDLKLLNIIEKRNK